MTDLSDLASAIAKMMPTPIPVDVDCWSAKECSAFFKCSPSNFNQYIKTHPKFPRPIRIPLAKLRADGRPMKSQELWKATEIIDYADRCQDR